MATNSFILCVNSGSSSLKFALYRMGTEPEALIAGGAVERIGLAGGRLWVHSADRKPLAEGYEDFPDHTAALRGLHAAAEGLRLPPADAIGHRVVHGGPDHTRPERITPELVETLRELVAFAPLHLPSEILCIEAALRRFPDRPQVACFDTAFHRRMPERAQRFPLPRALWEEGVRRYGFHGLSYEYIVEMLGDATAGRVIVAHLGNGASMAAIKDGQPIDTTMGFTPSGGLMMGTRTGDLDPGILLYLINEKRYDARRLARLVDHEAGLLGVSDISSDMKTLLDRRASDPHAAQAVELFCYQLRKTIGALAAALGGLDTLVFTGGIGERAATVRWEVCRGLECLGVRLDGQRNEDLCGCDQHPTKPLHRAGDPNPRGSDDRPPHPQANISLSRTTHVTQSSRKVGKEFHPRRAKKEMENLRSRWHQALGRAAVLSPSDIAVPSGRVSVSQHARGMNGSPVGRYMHCSRMESLHRRDAQHDE